MINIIHEDISTIYGMIEDNKGFSFDEINQVDERGSNALFYSDVVKADFLLKCGIDAHHKNNDGRNALFFSDYLTSITLIAFGVDFYTVDNKGMNIAEFILKTFKNENKLIMLKDKIKLCIRMQLDISPETKLTAIQKKIVQECIEEISLENSAMSIIKNAVNLKNNQQ